jgi:hypothetical protein
MTYPPPDVARQRHAEILRALMAGKIDDIEAARQTRDLFLPSTPSVIERLCAAWWQLSSYRAYLHVLRDWLREHRARLQARLRRTDWHRAQAREAAAVMNRLRMQMGTDLSTDDLTYVLETGYRRRASPTPIWSTSSTPTNGRNSGPPKIISAPVKAACSTAAAVMPAAIGLGCPTRRISNP